MRQNKTAKIKTPVLSQIIKERLWNEGKLGKVNRNDLAEEFYGATNFYTKEKTRHLIDGVRKELEDFTGHILIVDHGTYELVPHSELGKVDVENDKRQGRVISHLNSLKRTYKTILLHKPKATQYLRGKYDQLTGQINRTDPTLLATEAKSEEKKRGLVPTEDLLRITQ